MMASVVPKEILDRVGTMPLDEQAAIYGIMVQSCVNRGNVLRIKWNQNNRCPASFIGLQVLQVGTELLTWQEKLLAVQKQKQAAAGE